MNRSSDIAQLLRAALPGLRRQWPNRALALFGSRSRNDVSADSDLDVLVEFDRPIPLIDARARRGDCDLTATRDFRDFLADMVAACRSIISFSDGMTLDAYLADEKTRFAVMRAYEILGEAIRHLPEALKSEHSDIPWAAIAHPA